MLIQLFDKDLFLFLLLLASFSIRGVSSTMASPEYIFEVREDERIGTVVKDLRLLFHNPAASFQIIGPEYVLKYFSMDSSSGVIRVNHSLDLEDQRMCTVDKVCCVTKGKKCKFNFYLQILHGTIEGDLLKAQIIIKDINDWAPEFSAKKFSVSFKEGPESVSTQKSLFQAIDKDFSWENRVKSYRLKPEHPSFQLVQKGKKLYLKLLRELDREEHSSYQFRLVAVDGGGKEGYAVINVSVTDKNEHRPSFLTDTVPQFDVSESSLSGYVITQLHAKDKDAYPNNKIKYDLDPGNAPQILKTFWVDPSTGELSLKKQLDYEGIKVYDISVIAVDSPKSDDPKTASITITVRVTDSNDNKPEIKLIGASGNKAWVDENSRVGTKVASILVIDQDTGDLGMVSCELTESENFFKLDPHDEKLFNLETRTVLDREKRASYRVRIKCKDLGSPSQYSEVKLTVNVRDKNDEIPKFARSVYKFEIRENSPIGQPLTPVSNIESLSRVVANDKDVNDNVTYELRSGATQDYQLFKLLKNGTIVNNGNLDRESKHTMLFKVSANDGINTVYADIFVTILDVNDNNPEFDQKYYLIKVQENQSRYDPLLTFHVNDRDSGNKKIEYSLEYNVQPTKKPFFLRKNQLYLNGKLDREEQHEYEMKIKINDFQPGFEQRTSEATIYVTVVDVNDNSPRFIFPNSTNNVSNISCLESAGTPLVKVEALDPDEGINGTVNYTILATRPSWVNDLLYLDPSRGQIFLAKNDLRDFCGFEFHLTLRAEDMGEPLSASMGKPLATMEVLHLRLLNVPPQRFASYNGLPPRVVLCIILGSTTIFLVCLVVAYLFLLYYKKRRRNSPGSTRKGGDTVSCVVAFTREKEVICPNLPDIYTEHLIDAMVEYEGACSDVTTQSRMTPSRKHYSPYNDSAYCDLTSRDSWKLGSVDTGRNRVHRSGSDYLSKHQSGKFVTSVRARTSSSLARIAQPSPTPAPHYAQLDSEMVRPYFTPQMKRKDMSAGSSTTRPSTKRVPNLPISSKSNKDLKNTCSNGNHRSTSNSRSIHPNCDKTAQKLATFPALHCRVPVPPKGRERSTSRSRSEEPTEDLYTTLVHEKPVPQQRTSTSGPSSEADSKSTTYISLPQVHTTFV